MNLAHVVRPKIQRTRSLCLSCRKERFCGIYGLFTDKGELSFAARVCKECSNRIAETCALANLVNRFGIAGYAKKVLGLDIN